MTIERTATETVIRIPSSQMTFEEVQDLLDYLLSQELKDKNETVLHVLKALDKHELKHLEEEFASYQILYPCHSNLPN